MHIYSTNTLLLDNWAISSLLLWQTRPHFILMQVAFQKQDFQVKGKWICGFGKYYQMSFHWDYVTLHFYVILHENAYFPLISPTKYSAKLRMLNNLVVNFSLYDWDWTLFICFNFPSHSCLLHIFPLVWWFFLISRSSYY